LLTVEDAAKWIINVQVGAGLVQDQIEFAEPFDDALQLLEIQRCLGSSAILPPERRILEFAGEPQSVDDLLCAVAVMKVTVED
jgi:hypothetical protein